MSEEQDKFVSQIKQQLDEQCEALDNDTRSRLQQARMRALQTESRKGFSVFGLNSVGASAVAFASVSVLAIAVWLAVPGEPGTHSELIAEMNQEEVFEDLELLATAEALEFFDEELEFYYWLEAQDAQG